MMSLSSGICFVRFLIMLELAKEPEAKKKNVLRQEQMEIQRKRSNLILESFLVMQKVWGGRSVCLFKAIDLRNELFQVRFHWAKRTGRELMGGTRRNFFCFGQRLEGQSLCWSCRSCCGDTSYDQGNEKVAGMGGSSRAREWRSSV